MQNTGSIHIPTKLPTSSTPSTSTNSHDALQAVWDGGFDLACHSRAGPVPGSLVRTKLWDIVGVTPHDVERRHFRGNDYRREVGSFTLPPTAAAHASLYVTCVFTWLLLRV